MPTTILQTKLFIPPANPDHIPRQRLLERLNSGLGTKLTLVTAPPGFGKTSIIAAWVKQTGLPAGWLSLDARDNDPAQSFSHFLAALPDKAVALLTPLVVTIRKAGRRRSLLERLIVLARAYQVLNDLPSAARTIQEALTIAESHGFLRSILDDGQELQPLLQLALQQNAAPHYITHPLNLISSPQP